MKGELMNLREARLKKKLYANDIAKLLNVTKATVSRWENYLQIPRLDTQKKLEELLETHIEFEKGNT